MAQRVTRTSAYEQLILRMLVYGEGGSGKTRFINSFDKDPRTARVLHLSFAGNPVSIMMEDPEPFVIECSNPDDVNLPWEFLVKGQPKKHRFRDVYELPEDLIFKTVAIDTLTEVQRQVNARLVGAERIPTGWKKMRIQDWGDSFGVMLNIARLFYEDCPRAIPPLHVVMSVQQRIDYDDKEQVAKIHVALQGQAKDTVHQYAELAARLERRAILPKDAPPGTKAEIGTVAFFDIVGAQWAKNQLSMALGTSMAFPTGAKILDTVLGSPQWAAAQKK